MSNITGNRKRKDTKLTYKQLWETELNNRKMYEKQYRDLHERYVELQKGTEMPKLKLQIRQLSADLQDTEMFRIQETIAKETLLNRQIRIENYISKLDNKVVAKKELEEILKGKYDEEDRKKDEEEKKDGKE